MKWLVAFALTSTAALAEPPVITAVSATQTGDTWQFSVTIAHPDTGWDHYADGWRVLDMDGNELGMRVLAHPHVNEQPFTRTLSGVEIPAGTRQVQIQARALPDGWNEETTQVNLRP
jgi:hypothetical protein